MKHIIIAALAAIIIISGCTSPPPSATASHPFIKFVDPITEEVPHVQIDQ